MSKKLSKILAVIIVNILIVNVIQPQKIYAYTTTPKIIAGLNNALALKSDGAVYGWGYNTGSLVGLGYSSNSVTTPTQVLTNVKDISEAYRCVFAVFDDGSVKTWGTNNSYQMGIGSGNTNKEGYDMPTLHPFLTNVKKIIASNWSKHAFAILNDNTVMGWGLNSVGELGNGTTSYGYVPTTSPFTNVQDIAVGSQHTLVLKNDGTLYSTGYNNNGQLGIGTTTNKSTLTLISSLSGVSKIFAGSTNSFAIKNDGTVYAWGFNGSGCLGIGLTGKKTSPVLVSGLSNVSQISVNQNLTIALMVDGTVKTAGNNTYGGLGYYTGGSNSLSFNTVPGITNAVQVQAGEYFSMVLLADGTVVIFGKNTYGELGLGFADTNTHLTPTVIPNLSLIQDTTPPIITIGSYNTNPTNQNITVTASTNEGTLNQTSYTFTENGSFEFVATDKAGNVAKKTVTVSNIDKVAPSKPSISVIQNKLVIASGIDEGSGVKETRYQINNGEWTVYSNTVTLADGTYVIRAKTLDNAGNESSIEIYNANVYGDAVTVATEALVKAEGTYLQSDLDTAKVLINALPDSNEKSDLMKRADNLQKAIDNNKEIIILADSDEVMRLKMVNLTIKTQDLTDLYTVQLELKYDPEKLELDQTSIKNLAWDNSSNGYSAIKADPGTGVVKLIYSRKGNNLGVNQVNDLISVPFKALKIGKTTVEVNKFKVTNSQGIKLKESNSSFKKEINIIPNPLNIVVTGDKGQNDWYISPVTVEVNSLDAKEINYSIDGTQHSYTQPFTIQEIGEHKLVAAIDDGNGYTEEKEQEINIDFESPEISLSSHRNNKQSELNRMPVLDTQMNAQQYELNMVPERKDQINNWQNEINVTPSVNDQNGSGMSKTWYQWSNTDEQPEQWEEYQMGELTQTTEGTWYLHIKAMDMAGNISQNVFGPYNVERVAPVISVDNPKREAWAATDVTVLPTFSDEGGSQLKKMGYLWSLEKDDPSAYTTYSSGSLSQSKDGSWYLHLLAEDGAGNMKTMTYGPYNIDKNAPVIEFSDVSDGTDYTDSVTPIIAISDTASGIKSKTIMLDGDDYASGTPIIERGVHTITATAEDFIGNITTKSVSFTVYTSTTLTLNIPPVDVNDPYTITATLTTGSQSVTGSAISVTGSAISVSGAAISIKLNGQNVGTYYTDSDGKVTLSGIHSLTAGSYAVEAVYLPEESQYLVASQSHSSLTVTSANNKISNTEKYQLLHPGELKIQATVSQKLDIKSEDISLEKYSIEILKVGKDDAVTHIDTFVTECDSKGIIAFKRTYDKGDYKVNIKPLNDEAPATNTVSISVHVN